MPSPLPMPVRVLVKGASTVNWTSYPGGPRTDFAFPRAIEAHLLGVGRPCDVQTYSTPGERANTILRTWEREVLGYSPDVIVLYYGHTETILGLLPERLERHVNSLKGRPTRLAMIYREKFLRPSWGVLARLQSKLEKVIDPTFRRRHRKVAAYVQRYIENVQKIGSPLVLVMEILPPAGRFRSWFPGMAARVEATNQALADVVATFDRPNVRHFTIAHLVESHAEGDIDAASPDGVHFAPFMHAAVGQAIGAEIAEWASTQPHLK